LTESINGVEMAEMAEELYLRNSELELMIFEDQNGMNGMNA
jgi:hypothetical protein